MKRIGGNIYDEIVAMDNLIAADIISRRGKEHSRIMYAWDKDWFTSMDILQKELDATAYFPDGYHSFRTNKADKSAKVREISVCVNYRDRVVHQAAIQVLGPYFKKKLTADTYATIPGRGPHRAIAKIKKLMKSPGDLYCLKMDIRKFYPSINNEIMIDVLSKMIKCQKTMCLLARIVNSHQGLPIGNLTSQWFGNLYLNELDHLAKEKWKAAHYFRYCDDLILIGHSKDQLHDLARLITGYLREKRRLEVKPSWAVFKIGDRKRQGRGIDFLGYVFFREHTDLRKSTKLRWRKKLRQLNRAAPSRYDVQAAGSLKGILQHCDSRNLIKHFLHDYKDYFERLQHGAAARTTAA